MLMFILRSVPSWPFVNNFVVCFDASFCYCDGNRVYIVCEKLPDLMYFDRHYKRNGIML